MRAVLLIAALTVFIGCLPVNSSNGEKCMRFLADNRINDNMCKSTTEFSKCVFMELGLDIDVLTEEEIQVLQKSIDDEREKGGILCSIEVRPILEEISNETKEGLIETTKTPTGFSDSVKFMDCINTMRRYSNEQFCDILRPFLKCIFRSTNFLKKNKNFYDILVKSTQDVLNKEGLNCSVDVIGLLSDTEREYGEQIYTTSRTTDRNVTAVYTTIQSLPKLVTSEPRVTNRSFSNADSLNECRHALKSQLVLTGAKTCDLMTSYVKCVFRVQGRSKNFKKKTEKTFQYSFHDLMKQWRLYCLLQVRNLITEVAVKEIGVYSAAQTLTEESGHAYVETHATKDNKDVYYTAVGFTGEITTASNKSHYKGSSSVWKSQECGGKTLVENSTYRSCEDICSAFKCEILRMKLYKQPLTDEHTVMLGKKWKKLTSVLHLKCSDSVMSLIWEVQVHQGWSRGTETSGNVNLCLKLLMFFSFFLLVFQPLI